MNKFYLISGLAGSATFFSCTQQFAEKEAPNIIILFADDMGYSDIQPYGSEIPTPNLNRLAEEGILFTNFYNSARCCPSRAAILTGLYPHQAGMGGMADQHLDIKSYQGYLSMDAVTIAELLKMKNYHTYMSGKWHLGDKDPFTPVHRGFDKSFAFLNGATSYFNLEPYRDSAWIEKVGPIELQMRYNGKDYTPPEQGFYTTDAYTEKAMEFIREDAGDDKPFFLYLAYNAPHWPLHAPAEIIENYVGSYSEGWDEVRRRRFERQKTLGIIPQDAVLPPSPEELPQWETLSLREQSKYDRKMAVYAAMIDRMDWNIGRLLETLDSTGNIDNTIIFFLSDNGADRTDEIPFTDHLDKSGPIGSERSFTGYGPGWAGVSNTPFRKHKATIYFGGIATPFIAWYPGTIGAGIRSGFRGHIIDLMPTILDLASLDYPNEYNGHKLPGLPGVSLLPALKGEEVSRKPVVFFEHYGNKGMLDDNWKLVAMRNEDWKLYNITEDPTEMNDLSDSLTDKRNTLVNHWDYWADSIDVLPVDELNKHNLKKK